MGLEETLSAWYPAAGRLCISPDNGKLDLACTNSGALLVEAATHLEISELGDLSQYNDFYEHLVFRPPFSGSFSDDIPLVVAQVTMLGCGGYAVGVGTNHSLFDGLAVYNFMHAWASKTVGKADEAVELVEPVHERGRLLVSCGQIEENLTGPGGRENLTRYPPPSSHPSPMPRPSPSLLLRPSNPSISTAPSPCRPTPTPPPAFSHRRRPLASASLSAV